jgi:hypothetical protein
LFASYDELSNCQRLTSKNTQVQAQSTKFETCGLKAQSPNAQNQNKAQNFENTKHNPVVRVCALKIRALCFVWAL